MRGGGGGGGVRPSQMMKRIFRIIYLITWIRTNRQRKLIQTQTGAQSELCMDFITVYWNVEFKICVITSSRQRFIFPSAAKLKPAVIQPAEPTHVSMFHCPGSRFTCRARGRSCHREAGDEPEHHHPTSKGEKAHRSHKSCLVKGSGDEAESVQTEISNKNTWTDSFCTDIYDPQRKESCWLFISCHHSFMMSSTLLPNLQE